MKRERAARGAESAARGAQCGGRLGKSERGGGFPSASRGVSLPLCYPRPPHRPGDAPALGGRPALPVGAAAPLRRAPGRRARGRPQPARQQGLPGLPALRGPRCPGRLQPAAPVPAPGREAGRPRGRRGAVLVLRGPGRAVRLEELHPPLPAGLQHPQGLPVLPVRRLLPARDDGERLHQHRHHLHRAALRPAQLRERADRQLLRHRRLPLPHLRRLLRGQRPQAALAGLGRPGPGRRLAGVRAAPLHGRPLRGGGGRGRGGVPGQPERGVCPPGPGPLRLPARLHAGPVPARGGRHAPLHAGRHLPGRERQVQLLAHLYRHLLHGRHPGPRSRLPDRRRHAERLHRNGPTMAPPSLPSHKSHLWPWVENVGSSVRILRRAWRTKLTAESPLWVGAWWVGFLGAGTVAFLIAIPILGYPRQLPGSQRYVVMRAAETHQLTDSGHKAASSPAFGKTVRDLPLSIWLLLRNPTFILLCLAGATEATLIAGMSTFGPKFLEAQFSLSASEAATLFGYLVVPAGGGGTLLGGFLVNRFKLRGPGIIRFCLLCTLTSLLAFFIFLTHCENVPMAGVTAGYGGSLWQQGRLNLTAGCNEACGCRPEHYSPVCGSDRLMYYSPCHAGCARAAPSGPGGGKVYRDCSCVPSSAPSGWGNATAGKCASACQRKPLFLVLVFVVIVFTFLSSIPALTATLRCVRDRQRSFALGIQWIVVRTLGSIPGPIAFGWVIDKACLLWQDQCGQQGSCFVYQNAAMSRYMLTAGLSYKVLGLLFFTTACFLYKSPSGSSDGLDTSLPSQSSASDGPADPQLQSRV